MLSKWLWQSVDSPLRYILLGVMFALPLVPTAILLIDGIIFLCIFAKRCIPKRLPRLRLPFPNIGYLFEDVPLAQPKPDPVLEAQKVYIRRLAMIDKAIPEHKELRDEARSLALRQYLIQIRKIITH